MFQHSCCWKFTKNQWIIHLKWVNYMIYKCLYKFVKKIIPHQDALIVLINGHQEHFVRYSTCLIIFYLFVYMSVRSTWEFSVLSLQFFYKSKFIPKFERIKDLRTRIIMTLRNTISMSNSICAHPYPLLTTCVGQTQGPHAPRWHGQLHLCRETHQYNTQVQQLCRPHLSTSERKVLSINDCETKTLALEKHKTQCRHFTIT